MARGDSSRLVPSAGGMGRPPGPPTRTAVGSAGDMGRHYGDLPKRPGSNQPVLPFKSTLGTSADKWDPNAIASAREQGKRNNEIRGYNNSKAADIERSNTASTKKSAMMNKYPAPGAGNTEDQADKVARRKGWSY